MADQIPRANEISFSRDGRTWTARIGPRGTGLEAEGGTWEGAVRRLVTQCERLDWPVDDGWRDHLE